MAKHRVSIDIGGTFTDLIAYEEKSGKLINIKVPSTPQEPAKAVIKAFQDFLTLEGDAEISQIIHATTLATNVLLGQLNLELPKTALITTKGFRDVIEIGRQRRPQLYNLFVQKPHSLIPRRLRFELEERIGPNGEILTPFNQRQAQHLITQLKTKAVDAIAVALLFSHANPAHERHLGKLLKKSLPNAYISLSSTVTPEYREYERTSTTVVNAVLMPIVSNYLNDLYGKMQDLGVKAPLCVMQSDGGIATRSVVTAKPVSIVESGPAAGVIASAFYGGLLSIKNSLSFDMGGTTAKAGAIKEATPEVVGEYEVGSEIHSGRIVKGSGYPVRFPFLDLAECSAGGGTIAWVDDGGALRVGPISAGADPGPACYGKGGKQPTVTDANVVLGRLNPKYLLGGEMQIQFNRSEKAILHEICEKTKLDLDKAAAGILKIVNSAMAKILRIVSVERGSDPRDFTLIAFGGAGPMHGYALAEELTIDRMIIPQNPGLFSAYGMLSADFKTQLAKPIIRLIDEIDAKNVEIAFQRLESNGRNILEKQRVPRAKIRFIRLVDLRYSGQSYELTVPTSTPCNTDALYATADRFHEKHKAIYGYAVEHEPLEVVNLKLIAIGLTDKPKLRTTRLHDASPLSQALIGQRSVFFEYEDDFIETPIFDRRKLKAGNRINGPAVVEQYDATTIIPPNWITSVDRFENLLISRKGDSSCL